jgi:hypothetical protein
MVQISQPGHQVGFLDASLVVHWVLLGGDRTAKSKRYQDAYRELHGGFSSVGLRALDKANFTPTWAGN